MQFDFKEKAKKRQDRNSPIKPFFVYNLKIHPKFHGVNSKFLWGLFSPHGVPPFLTAPTKVWLPDKKLRAGARSLRRAPFCFAQIFYNCNTEWGQHLLSFFILATSLFSERMVSFDPLCGIAARMVLCLLKTRIMQQRNNALAFLVHRVKLSRKYAGIVL